ncbi:hypothetical protein KM043_005117 [Ampulex compressa]|nr:hypothetical protein KM043_005117 [Ampulex compressa]
MTTLQVSWVRYRDIHLLTIGRYTYTNDQRFRAIHNAHTDDWTLQIKYPQHRDSGIYECQISTTPHMSHFVHLNVIVQCCDHLPSISSKRSQIPKKRCKRNSPKNTFSPRRAYMHVDKLQGSKGEHEHDPRVPGVNLAPVPRKPSPPWASFSLSLHQHHHPHVSRSIIGAI